MNSARQEALFALALEKAPGERGPFLDRECGGDKALRARLDALLVAHEQPETLLVTQAETARPTLKLETTHASLHDIGLGFSHFAHHYYGNHCVFFSWHYLDVSVHAVSFFIL